MADTDFPCVTETPRKRKLCGRKRDDEKKMRLSNHTMGNPCNCKRLKCFDVIDMDKRQAHLDRFNAMKTKNEQDVFIASCISLVKIQRRRPRQDENNAFLHDVSFRYHLLIRKDADDHAENIQICFTAFLSIFGITKSRLERIQKSLKTTGK